MSSLSAYPPGHPLHNRDQRGAPPPAGAASSRDAGRSPPQTRNRGWNNSPQDDRYGAYDASRGGGSGPGYNSPPVGWGQPMQQSGPAMPRQQNYNSAGPMDFSQPSAPEPNMWMAALNAQSQNTQLTQVLGDVRVELTAVNLQFRQLQNDYDALDRDYQSLREERADLVNEVQRLRRQLADARAPRPGSERGDDDRRGRREGRPRSASSPPEDPPRRGSPSNNPARRAASPLPLQQRISEAERPSLATRISLRSPPPLSQRLSRRSASPIRTTASGKVRGEAPTLDVVMTDAPSAASAPRTADVPPSSRTPVAESSSGPTGSAVIPTGPRSMTITAPVGEAAAPPSQDPPPPAPLSTVPSTRGLSDEQIDALRNHADPDLEESHQPLSAWYCRWICIPSMAEDYVASEYEPHQPGDDYATGEADFNEADCPFPDPIAARRSDMTPAAEQKETYRLSRVRTSADTVARALLTFHDDTRHLRDWAGTAIRSVVQAHNLRWQATVEFDPAAISFLRAVRQLYNTPQLHRSAGVRYLQATSPADCQVINMGRRRDLGEYRPTLSSNTFPYPSPDAPKRTVCNYYRNVPTLNWSMGIRRADGALPTKEARQFGVPSPDDAYGAFIAKHTQTIPKSQRTGSTKNQSAAIRQGLLSLFAVPGLYRHLCDLGGYFVHPLQKPAAYPFKDVGPVLLAAWLAEFGMGDDEAYISYVERWAKLTRERPTHSKTRDLPFSTLEEFAASSQALQVVGRESLQWGSRAFESEHSPSTRAFVPESDDAGSEPSVGQPRAPRSGRRTAAPREDEEDAVSFGSQSDDEFGMRDVVYTTGPKPT